MQSGNYNRSPNYGQKTKFQQNDGVFLQLSSKGNNNFNLPSSHMQCQNSPVIRRNFCTSSPQNMCSNPKNLYNSSGTTTPLVKNTNTTAAFPPFNGFLSGIRSIVNKLNCDFYSDHHRYYNPNYGNNYRMDMQQNFTFFGSNPIRVCPPETSHFHQTVLYNLSSVHEQKSINDFYHKTNVIPSPFPKDQKFNKINPSSTNANMSTNFTPASIKDNQKIFTTVPTSISNIKPVVSSIATNMNSEMKSLNGKSIICPPSSKENQMENSNIKVTKPENFSLFDEDFPELPPPKITPTVSSIWAKAKPSVLCKKSDIKAEKSALTTPTPTTNNKMATPTSTPPSLLSSTSSPSTSPNTMDKYICNLKETPKYCYFEIIIKPAKKNKPLRVSKRPKRKSTCLNTLSHSSCITTLIFEDNIGSDYDSDDNFCLLSSSPSNSYSSLSQSTAGSTPFRPIINCRRRPRQMSECSDDGFYIYFSDDVTKGSLDYSDSDIESDGSMLSDDTDDEDDDDDDDDDDNEIDDEEYIYENDNKDEGVDEVDADLHTQKNLKTDQNNICAYLEDSKQPDSGFHEKKRVCINPKPNVHVMRMWDYAYRSARKGEWERYARDRTRFKNRIDTLSELLNPILDSVHRGKIYRTRFCDRTKEDDGISIGGKNSSTPLSICQTIQV